MTLNQIGVTGAVLQMFSHGVIAGLLFAIVGRVVYERTHTRQLSELEGMHLSKRLPFAAWAFVLAGIASMGFPGKLRFRRRIAGAGWFMAVDTVVDSDRGDRHRDRRGLYLARFAKGVLQRWSRGCARARPLARVGSYHLA